MQVSSPGDTAWPPYPGSDSSCKELPSSPPCFLPPTLCTAPSAPTSPSLGLLHPALVTAETTEPGAALSHTVVALEETLTCSLQCTCHCFPIPKHQWWLSHPSPVFLHTLWVNPPTQAQHVAVCRGVSSGQVPPAAQTRQAPPDTPG